MPPPPRPHKRPAHGFLPEEQADLKSGPSDQNDEDDDVSSDWDEYGQVPEAREDYDRKVTMLEGAETWNAEQSKVHKLIYMRGIHPMISSSWRHSYKMWGVTQPHLDDVFTPPLSRKRVVISANNTAANRNEADATKALENLFYLSQTVSDYEELGQKDKIGPTVVKAISAYIRWALRDVEVDKRLPPTMMVHAYPKDFAASPEAVEDKNQTQDRGVEDVAVAGSSDDDLEGLDGFADLDAEGKKAVRLFQAAVSQHLERKMRAMARAWRQLLRHKNARDAAPTLYGFAVTQHMVLVVSHDANRIKNPVVCLEQITLNERGLWLWNAMSIAIPVNVAKKAVHRLFKSLEQQQLLPEPESGEEEDPDK
ncbi:hypothetical protein QBC39DRAFT_369236 [Podospora conica]|nr:hypothetical protein QBC39DRAFT_369236 [Schizothecium conicum]